MDTAEQSSASDPNGLWKWLWLIVTTGALLFEVFRLKQILDAGGSVDLWLLFWHPESTAPLLVLLSLPVIQRIAPRRRRPTDDQHFKRESVGRTAAGGLLICLLSFFCNWWIGSTQVQVSESTAAEFADLPPAYHDEYSYLLQAKLFHDGRVTAPAVDVRPDLFHQFHVLNERVTASRYFPWPALWMAAFVDAERPVIGQWVAGTIAAGMFYLALCQVLQWRIAFLSGLLIAVSPGLSVFSNLMLSHHPVLVGLALFVAAFFRMQRTDSGLWAGISGVGLTLAMLGRPMTAAGFALPFGIWLSVAAWRREHSWKLLVGFAVPLMTGFTLLGLHNRAVTGSFMSSAYQEYTDTFTPRHRYGFGNGMEKNPGNGPPVIQKYDEWADDLTIQRAAANVWNRLLGSLRWTWATVPLALCCLAGLVCILRDPEAVCRGKDNVIGIRLLILSIVTLHIVHIPYWYDGIQHWHYVFESCVPLLILAAVGCCWIVRRLEERQTRRSARLWITALLLSGLVPGWIGLPMFDGASKTGAAVSELSFSRVRLYQFQKEFRSTRYSKPALVLVDERGIDPQLSYIINEPDMDGELLVCRRPETAAEIEDLAAAFPGHTIYHFTPPK